MDNKNLEQEQKNLDMSASKVSMIMRLKFIWLTGVAFVTAFIPFFGYTYLVSFLSGAGFEAVNVDPKIYDLVYYFLLGISDSILEIVQYDFFNVFLSVIIVSALVVTLLAAYFFVSSREGELKKIIELPEDESFTASVLTYLFKKSTHSKKHFFALYITSFTALSTGYMLSILTIFTLPVIFWGVAISGTLTGIDAGNELIKSKLCDETNLRNNKGGWVLGCSVIVVAGKEIKGQRIYMDKNATFFVSSSGAYQVSANGELIYFRPFLKNELVKVLLCCP